MFKKFIVNCVGSTIIILLSGHTIIQNPIGKRKKCSLCFKKGNQRRKKLFKLLHSNKLISGQAHQLASCWTDVCKVFSIFRF